MNKRKPPAAEEEDELRYARAVEEIEQILESIDREETDIDDLSTKVERAVQLIRLCQERLRRTEMRVTEVLRELEQAAPAGDAGTPPAPRLVEAAEDDPLEESGAEDDEEPPF